MTITTLAGEEIDITPWFNQMCENHRLKKNNVFERTPIGTTVNKGYFWWDEEENPALNKESVIELICHIKRESHAL